MTNEFLNQQDEFQSGTHPSVLPKALRITIDVTQVILCILSFIIPLAGVAGFVLALWQLQLVLLLTQSKQDILLLILSMVFTVLGLNSLGYSFASLILSNVQWLMDVESQDEE